MRGILESIFREALKALEPYRLIKDYLRLEGDCLFWGEKFLADLKNFRRVLLAGLGKGVPSMAQGILDVLGDRIESGVLVSHHFPSSFPKNIQTFLGSHPIPDEKSFSAGVALHSFLSHLREDDLVIFLTTGGGSSLAVYPVPGISLEDKALTFKALISAPLTIKEINSVRRKISRIKGGGLARTSFPARVINFIISDVVGDDLSVIASGPFSPDPDSPQETLGIISSHRIEEKIPERVRNFLRQLGKRGKSREDQGIFKGRIQNLIVASNLHFLLKCKDALNERGFKAYILSSRLEGEVKSLTAFHAQICQEIFLNGHPFSPPCALLSGGESTVHLVGDGIGGRNQEFALYFLKAMEGIKGKFHLLSCGTDGKDGNSEATGAYSSSEDFQKIRSLGLDLDGFLKRNDSFHFFEKTGGLIITGPTGTNLADVRIILLEGIHDEKNG